MTAVSSFRPFDQSAAIARNQLFAKASWERVFDRIIYFGTSEPKLASSKTLFIESEQFPTIDRLLTAASLTDDWCAVLNADIVVAANLPIVVRECQRKGIRAVTSKRYEFDAGNPNLNTATVVDSGYDFFMTDPVLWGGAARVVPKNYRIGHNRWDNWVLGYFNTVCEKRFVDISSRRCIFHPRHEERNQPHHIDVPNDKYLKLGRPPFYRLP